MPEVLVTVHLPDALVMVAYFAAVVFVGLWAGRFTRTTHEFFFAGQRFAWWLVAISCVATLVGSYSFQQYSQVGYRYGFASMMPYTNEWFVLPFFLIAWLPIIYFSRVQSIPEYFERRFDRRTRIAVMVVLLVYLIVYIGINLVTIGQLLDGVFGPTVAQQLPNLFGADAPLGSPIARVVLWATIMAVISAAYLHHGGQTSVLMTDLVQGFLLLFVGLGLFALGIYYVGGWGNFWQGLDYEHRVPLAQFNHPPGLHAVGDFWNDAVVGTFAFYCINQGILMRFMSAKSVRDGRKAMLVTVILFMPLAALAVSGAGLIGRAMDTHGQFDRAAIAASEAVDPENVDEFIANNVFVLVARTICRVPGMFGLVIAAVVAALMSTLDTLITAVSAVAVNDIWREVQPGRDDRYYLRAARVTAIASTIVGLSIIPIAMTRETIYQALSEFTSLILPPLIVIIVLGVLTRRFSARAAFWTLILGSVAMAISWQWPVLIQPLSHGVSAERGFPYLRGLFGLLVSLALAGVLTAIDRRWLVPIFGASKQPAEGLVLDTIEAARRLFKGAAPNDKALGRTIVLPVVLSDGDEAEVRLSQAAMEELEAKPGDILYVSDARWYLGGFRSLHAKAGSAADGEPALYVSRPLFEESHLLPGRPVRVEKIM